MKIYIVRHGETTWNAADKVSGRTDVPLTEKGMKQARRLAERMSSLPIDVILASPLSRAQYTAGCIAEKLGLPVQTDDRLIEQDYGIYEGVDRRSEDFLNNKRQFAFRYPQGESMMQVAARTYSLLDEIRRKYRGKNVLLVCHGGVIRVMRTYFEDMNNDEFYHYSMDNCGYLEYDLKDLPETADPPKTAAEPNTAGKTGTETDAGEAAKKTNVENDTAAGNVETETAVTDAGTSVRSLRNTVAKFNEDRGWTGLNAANLAMSISIEASELLEIFQWCDRKEADEKARTAEREHFLEEFADVMIYCIGMANAYDVDLTECIQDKLRKNAIKYPVPAPEQKEGTDAGDSGN